MFEKSNAPLQTQGPDFLTYFRDEFARAREVFPAEPTRTEAVQQFVEFVEAGLNADPVVATSQTDTGTYLRLRSGLMLRVAKPLSLPTPPSATRSLY